ncbi:hypothetical protein [Claveliimonas bilis]|uniref:Uncharacterized protein n=1 Tax=Claveliimonas bilis TaxID=3028070 RepID=A0ABM8I4P0_9FIRM|nr:hypothetical protein [Claveliimonas bilis]BDZ77219.1 hypothetical protein Lac1_14020 [Claveliimonas bilis]BDZ78858.1 hypothetical protein Lac3_00670 [Claveliimonas bilis]
MKLKDLQIGTQQPITLMVKKIEQATARNTTVYQRLTVRDTDGGEATILNWGDPMRLNVPAVINANLETSEYRETPSYRLIGFKVDDNADIQSFLPKPKIDAVKSWNDLVTMSKGMRESLRLIVGNVLTENKENFKHLPLSQSKSYARQNGVLEATLKLCKLVDGVCNQIELDRDLALSGAMLYYIGAVDTIDDAFNYTSADTLIGLGVSSYAKLMETVTKSLAAKDKVSKVIDLEEIKMVGHILLSRSKGIQTSIPEAIVLRHLDQIVTETELMENSMSDMEAGTSAFINGQKVYKKIENK